VSDRRSIGADLTERPRRLDRDPELPVGIRPGSAQSASCGTVLLSEMLIVGAAALAGQASDWATVLDWV
jgi:hypothetical protein